MTDSPNGRQSRKVTTRATRPVVTMRIGWSVLRSQARTLSSQPSRGGSSAVVGRVGRLVRVGDRPERPADRDQRKDRDEDPELRLDQRGDDREDRRPLRVVAPQLAQAEQQEDHADRIDLAPDDAVEPADRVDDRDERGDEGDAAPPAELEDHRPDEPADGQVGEDRRHLDQGDADPADRLSDEPEHPQDVQIARGVVVEEVALVEAVQALAGEVDRPRAERPEVHAEAGSGEEVCDDEAEGKTEREDHEDRADGSLRPGYPRRRSCASLGPAGRGASHRERLLHERGRWTGA